MNKQLFNLLAIVLALAILVVQQLPQLGALFIVADLIVCIAFLAVYFVAAHIVYSFFLAEDEDSDDDNVPPTGSVKSL